MPDEPIGPDAGADDRGAAPSEPPAWPYAPPEQARQPHQPSAPSNPPPPQPGEPYPQAGQPYPPYGHPGQPYPQAGQPYPPYGPAGQPYPQAGQPQSPPGQPYGQPGQPYPQAGQPSPYAPGGPGSLPPQPGGPGGPYGGPPPPYAWPYVPPTPKAPLTPEARRTRRRWAVTLVAVVVLALGAGVGIGAAIAPGSPKAAATSLLHRSMTAAAHAASYHYVERSRILGARDNIVGDALTGGGRQLIKQRCKTGLNIFDLRLTHHVVYFRGNAAAVIDQLGVPTTRAGPLVGTWVKVTKSASPYKSFAEGITTKSNVAQLPTVIVPSSTRAVPGSSPPSTQILGGLYAGKGKSPIGTAVLDVASASALPQTLRGSAKGTTGRYVVSWTFSHFGEKTTVTAPSGPVSYTSLHAKKPSTSTCV